VGPAGAGSVLRGGEEEVLLTGPFRGRSGGFALLHWPELSAAEPAGPFGGLPTGPWLTARSRAEEMPPLEGGAQLLRILAISWVTTVSCSWPS
jgi:hypothetical protein